MKTYRIIDDEKSNYLDYEADSVEAAAKLYCEEHYFLEVNGDEVIELQVVDPEGTTHDVVVDIGIVVNFYPSVV